MSVNSALTVDAWQINRLPRELRGRFMDWLRAYAPPAVADGAFHLALYEGCVEVTYFLRNEDGCRYVVNPEAPPEDRYAAQATWQSWECPPPPPEAMRAALAYRPATRQL